jgi:hypothetical protein
MELDLKQALSIALHHQLYRQHKLSGKNGVRELIRQLGYVQIDTISVVERAHHHTIWSRIDSYDKSHLDLLLEQDRAIFEYWGHAASYLPMEDFRYALPRMQRFPDANSWERQFFDKYHHLMDEILHRIRQEGALGTRDFSDTRIDKPANGWGSEKPAKLALELLFWKGELMVSRRQNFQRIYDLRERILPDWVDTRMPTEAESYRHYILRSLSAMGIGTLSDIQQHFMKSNKPLFAVHLQNLLEAGEILKVEVKGDNEAMYLLPETLKCLELPQAKARLYLLSPFDNLVIQRPRLKRLFGFDYTLECYVPPAKRVYGYWSLPMLYKDSFVGRLDCKADRKAKRLIVNTLHWEKGFKPNNAVQKALEHSLKAFAGFCGCESVEALEGLHHAR